MDPLRPVEVIWVCLAVGVTGQRASMESRVEGLIEQLHQITDKSVAVGFGVSGPEQVYLSL